jgi:hypothetical protein
MGNGHSLWIRMITGARLAKDRMYEAVKKELGRHYTSWSTEGEDLRFLHPAAQNDKSDSASKGDYVILWPTAKPGNEGTVPNTRLQSIISAGRDTLMSIMQRAVLPLKPKSEVVRVASPRR